MARICVLGSNSGRNAGDAAILSSIIRNLAALRPETVFEVPVPRKRDLYRRFSRANTRAVPMMRQDWRSMRAANAFAEYPSPMAKSTLIAASYVSNNHSARTSSSASPGRCTARKLSSARVFGSN